MTARGALRRCLLAAFGVAVALLVWQALGPWVGYRTLYALFLLAIVFSTLRGGLGAGLLAILMGLGVAEALLTLPLGIPSPDAAFLRSRMVGYLGYATVILLICGPYERARRRSLTTAQSEAEAQRREIARSAEAERVYQNLADGIGIHVWTTRPDGSVEFCNRHCIDYTGLNAETMNRGWPDVVHPDDQTALMHARDVARRGKVAFEAEYRLRRASDHVYRWHLGRVWPVTAPDGSVIRWLGTAMDVDDRRRSVESLAAGEERLRFALRAGRMVAWDWDVASGRASCVPADLPGGAREVAFASIEDLARSIHPDDRESVLADLRRALESGTPIQRVYRVGRDDGPVVWCEMRGMPMLDEAGRTYRVTGVCTNVSDRIRADEDLRRALQLAREAGLARDRFLAMLSHELRTPLTPVVLAAGEMLDDPALPERHRESVEMIRQNVAVEVRLIDDLLDISRAIRGKMQHRPEPVSAHNLIRRALEICRPEADAKGLRLVARLDAAPDDLTADPARIQQVLWNLVRNAVKFTPAAGEVRVTTRIEDDDLVVEVTDSGPGLEPGELERIFRPFEQVDTPGRPNDGLGLGLAISQSIAEAHGGSLRASSDGPGRGATFTLRLRAGTQADSAPTRPAAPADAESGERGPAADADAPALRILLVEDEPMTARVLARLLRQAGYEVLGAGSLGEALAAPVDDLDLIVSDISLPDGDGLDLMRRLRSRTDLPGIALTGLGTEDDRRRCREAGFVAHVTKPVDFERLDGLIRSVARSPRDRPSKSASRAEPAAAAPRLSPAEPPPCPN